jgi:hypothetical protein
LGQRQQARHRLALAAVAGLGEECVECPLARPGFGRQQLRQLNARLFFPLLALRPGAAVEEDLPPRDAHCDSQDGDDDSSRFASHANISLFR